MNKRTVRYFVSYAHSDEPLPEKLLTELQKQLGACRDYDFHPWRDTAILIGEKWHDEIQNAVRACDFGLLLVSPAFLGSRYIGEHELPVFVTGEKPCMPAALRKLDFEKQDLKGLESSQVFRFQSGAGKPLRAFSECSGNRIENFAHELFRHITERLGKIFGNAGVTSADSATPSAVLSSNLPKLQPFFGREEDLRMVAEAISEDSTTWGILIIGDGGQGKTSLAIKAAHKAPPGLFQRIVFLTAKKHVLDDDGVRPTRNPAARWLDMLNQCAFLIEQPEITKSPEDQREQLLLTALAAQPTLLILDNLESLTDGDRSAILGFLELLPAGCRAILTAREVFGNKANQLPLPPLDEKSALETLDDLSRHNPSLARESRDERILLIRETRGNALLLRWTAAQVGSGDCTCIADALAHLRSCPPENDALEFVFGDLANQFTPQDAAILATLTHATQPFPVEAIADIANVPFLACRRLLKKFANRSLVFSDETEKAYALVPMVADFLREKKRGVVAETGERLERRTFALIMENGGEQYSRFGELDRAWATIAACLPRFADGPSEKLQEVCHKLTHYFDISGRHDEKLVLAREAEQKALEAKDARNAGWRAFEIGWVSCERGDGESAIQWSDRARSHWLAAGNDPVLMAVAIYLRALGYRKQGDHSVAIVLLRDVIATWELGGPSLLAAALNALGETQIRKGQLDDAELNIRKSLKIGAGKGDRLHTAVCTINLASVSLRRQSWREAEAVGREALDMVNDLRAQSLIAEAGGILAVALHQQDKTPEALIHAQRSVEIYTRLGSPDLADAQATLAECEQALAK